MLNQVVLVGRLENINEIDNGKVIITLKVPRTTGETDYIDCVLYDNVAKNTIDFCKKEDVIGLKGKIASIEIDDGTKKMEIIGEKVSFLSTKKD